MFVFNLKPGPLTLLYFFVLDTAVLIFEEGSNVLGSIFEFHFQFIFENTLASSSEFQLAVFFPITQTF